MCGSHINTMHTKNHYDDNYSILTKLKIIETLLQLNHTTARPLTITFFTNKKNTRFQPNILSSLIYTNKLTIKKTLNITTINNPQLNNELKRISYTNPLPYPNTTPHAFIKLHIEQNPLLKTKKITISTITNIQNIS